MLEIAVLVSGGGTNLQSIIDAIDAGDIKNARIKKVISNNPGVYALERAAKAGIDACVISPKDYDDREDFIPDGDLFLLPDSNYTEPARQAMNGGKQIIR